ATIARAEETVAEKKMKNEDAAKIFEFFKENENTKSKMHSYQKSRFLTTFGLGRQRLEICSPTNWVLGSGDPPFVKKLGSIFDGDVMERG
ncbi:unnamed protein product, partial [Amoebophrya sp. A25]